MSVTFSGSIWDQEISIEILEWCKNVGDTVHKGEKLLKIREVRQFKLKNVDDQSKAYLRKSSATTKKTLKSPKDGLLVKICIDAGEMVSAENVLAKIYWFDSLSKK